MLNGGESPSGTDTLTAGSLPSGFAAQGLTCSTGSTAGSTNLSASTSLSQLLRPKDKIPFEIWTDVDFGMPGEYDQTGLVSSALGTSARGAGYMVGPYASVALTRNLFFDARAAFGQSANVITPQGLLRDHFDADRQLFRGELSGLFHIGTLEIAPSISALHFQEQQHAFATQH